MRGSSAGRAVVLGDAVRDRRPLWIYCESCAHNVERDPAELARRVGYDCPVPELKQRLRCSRCGSRRVDVRVRYASPGVVSRHGRDGE